MNSDPTAKKKEECHENLKIHCFGKPISCLVEGRNRADVGTTSNLRIRKIIVERLLLFYFGNQEERIYSLEFLSSLLDDGLADEERKTRIIPSNSYLVVTL